MHRIALAAIALALTPAFACGPEFLSTTTLASTGDDKKSSDSDTATWLVITAIAVVTSVVGLTEFSGGDMFGYMQEPRQDGRRALASGEGPFPSDLTAGLGLPECELPRVAQILRDGRARLEPCLETSGPIDEGEATEFWTRLLVLLR